MKQLHQCASLLVIVSIAIAVHATQENGATKSTKVRLSDFPVVKRWELPLKPQVVGRRHNDLWDENKKKRTFWEAKPQFTLHELEADEDPEKIYMDLHYSRNMLEEDDDDEKMIAQSKKKDTISMKTKDEKTIKGKSADKKRLIALKPFLSGKHVTVASKKRKRRHRRSIEDEVEDRENFESEEEDEGFQDGLMEETENVVGQEHDVENNNDQVNQQEEERAKRSLDSSSPLANFYFDQYDDHDSLEEGGSVHAPVQSEDDEEEEEKESQEDEILNEGSRDKRSVVSSNKQKETSSTKKTVSSSSKKGITHDENLSKVFKKSSSSGKTRPSLEIVSKRGATTVSTTSNTSSKTEAGSSTQSPDQKKVAKALIQKAFFSSNKHPVHLAVPVKSTVRHIVPQSSVKQRASIPIVDVKYISKNVDEKGDSKPKEFVKEETRQHIAHASSSVTNQEKSTDSINTANVARAVAVAMEQLKRDKMWGKVFVHVRPTGELKVMVQETKKMEDN